MSNSQNKPLATFRTKADTLRTLAQLLKKSSVEDIYVFTQQAWEQDKDAVITTIARTFQGKTIIIRSSALSEDTAEVSNAGYFESILNINSADPEAVRIAVEVVIGSYITKDCGDPENLILVQTQAEDIIYSGTILTRDYSGAPYYVLNYSEEDTTSVTSGRHSKSVKILQHQDAKVPDAFTGLLAAVQEIQDLATPGAPLDIEFGVKSNGSIVTFQVRPLVAAQTATFEDGQIHTRALELKEQFARLTQPKDHLHGDYTLLGDMPDWNPAEIIGNAPRLLAASLYDEIITNSIWHQARTSQGYTNVHPARLVVQLGNKPYIDVRNTFNSLIPASMPEDLKKKLLNFYLEKLKANPELQDKVEFDILYTCYDLSFDRRSRELQDAGFSSEEVDKLRSAVLEITNDLLQLEAIAEDIKQNEVLEQYRQSLPNSQDMTPQEHIERALKLLDACKENGTLQFSRLARLGFIGKSLLRSLVDEGVIDQAVYDAFFRSVNTVASEFAQDTALRDTGELTTADFIKKYGHLRPGTYDITIPRYDATDDYFTASQKPTEKKTTNAEITFQLSSREHDRISQELQKHGLGVRSEDLFAFVRSATEAREYSKFLFSKTLSDAIEAIANAGESLGLSRNDLSHLDINTIRDAVTKSTDQTAGHLAAAIEKHKTDYELNNYILLPPVIFSEHDIDVVSYYQSRPSFITSKKVTGDIVLLNGEAQDGITDKIVVIESADPGYDWVFTKGPAALITKYGGPASHMAIRCAESGLPAAIGVGETWYDSLKHATTAILDCENERIESQGKAL